MKRKFMVVMLLLLTLAGVAPQTQAAAPTPSTDKVIFFSSDGMRPDIMENYAAQGHMPTYADLMREGHLLEERPVNRCRIHHSGYAPFSATMPASSRCNGTMSSEESPR